MACDPSVTGSKSRAGAGLKHSPRGNQARPGSVTLAGSLTVSGLWRSGDSRPSAAVGRLRETTRVMCARQCLLRGGRCQQPQPLCLPGGLLRARSPAERRRPQPRLLHFPALTAPLPPDLTLWPRARLPRELTTGPSLWDTICCLHYWSGPAPTPTKVLTVQGATSQLSSRARESELALLPVLADPSLFLFTPKRKRPRRAGGWELALASGTNGLSLGCWGNVTPRAPGDTPLSPPAV